MAYDPLDHITSTNPVVQVLVRRDGMRVPEAIAYVKSISLRIQSGREDPDTILHEELGLEPDYIFDLL